MSIKEKDKFGLIVKFDFKVFVVVVLDVEHKMTN